VLERIVVDNIAKSIHGDTIDEGSYGPNPKEGLLWWLWRRWRGVGDGEGYYLGEVMKREKGNEMDMERYL